MEELEFKKSDLSKELEKAIIYSTPTISKNEIIDYFSDMAGGDIADVKYCQKLIDTFVKSIHLFDDKLIISFNYGAPPDDDKKSKNKISEIPIDISKCSDIKEDGVPNKNLKVDRNLEVFALYFSFK